jgi:hypothetical protein
VNEPNLFGNSEFLKDPKLVNDQSATSDLGWNGGESQVRSATAEPADEVVAGD